MIHSKKMLLSALLLASGLGSQSAMAISTYNSNTSITYTITAINQNSLGTLDSLEVIDANPDFLVDENSPSASSLASDSLTHFSDFNTSYTPTFQSSDSINTGTASSEYWWNYSVGFNNTSSNASDIFDITISYAYDLNANVSGEHADSDAFFAYSNEDDSISDDYYTNASTAVGHLHASASDSQLINFSLAAGNSETFYFDTGFSGDLQTSSVPVPAAFWLFSSALLAFPGFRKLKV